MTEPVSVSTRLKKCEGVVFLDKIVKLATYVLVEALEQENIQLERATKKGHEAHEDTSFSEGGYAVEVLGTLRHQESEP